MRSISHDDDDDEACIRIGKNYQAHIPSILDDLGDDPDPGSIDECVWNPDGSDNAEIECFVSMSKKLGWAEHDALTILHACGADEEKAKTYLNTLEPKIVTDYWSDEDRATFESGFGLFGKNFTKINTWLKHKTVPDLVELYYYLKSKSEMHSPRLQPHTIPHNVDSMVKRCKSIENRLENVLDISVLLKNIDKTMCNVTLDNSVDLSIDEYRESSTKSRIQIQNHKSQLYELRTENEKLLQLVTTNSKDTKKPSIIYRWEDQEIYYFSLGIKDFGKDYVKISKIIQTKTAAQLEKFYNENHEKFLLSNSYEEYMEKHGANQASIEADAAGDEPEVIDNEPIDLPCEVTILD